MAAAQRASKALRGNIEHLTTIKDRDPKSIVRHGRHIYLFCNVITKQVLYSFYPGLDDSHLKQLPFIGKKSKPPQIRRDHWKPYCTVTFDTPDQGLSAFRKLRELRKRHETEYNREDWHQYLQRWKEEADKRKDDEELKHWSEQTKDERKQHKKDVHKKKIHFVMDQRANSVADLAAVLAQQKEQGVWMQDRYEKRNKEREFILGKRWSAIEEAAKRVEDGHIETLEKKIADTKALLEADPAPEGVKRQHLERGLENLHHSRKYHQGAQRKWKELQAAKGKDAEAIRNSLLPKDFQKGDTEPFRIQNTVIEWAELHDAYFAKEWPEGVVHDTMGPLRNKRPHVPGMEKQEHLMTEEELAQMEEADALAEQEAEAMAESGQKFMREEEKPRSGIMKYLPKIKNPFSKRH